MPSERTRPESGKRSFAIIRNVIYRCKQRVRVAAGDWLCSRFDSRDDMIAVIVLKTAICEGFPRILRIIHELNNLFILRNDQAFIPPRKWNTVAADLPGLLAQFPSIASCLG